MLRFVPDEWMLKVQYRIKCGRRLDLKSPQRYTEKIQWYKLNYLDEKMRLCADKYLVRQYIEEKGLGHILNDLYVVFQTPEDINLDALPEKLVLKVSNGSSTNLLCTDKSLLDQKQVQKRFREYLIQSNSRAGREWVYNGGRPVIVAEKLMEDAEQPNGALRDHKILCFNGEPAYIICVAGRYTDDYSHVVYDPQWNKQNVIIGESAATAEYSRPVNLDRMLEIARILSADFPAVRVDLYSIEGRIYFGELTFFPWSGYMMFQPDFFDFTLGDKFKLPTVNHGDN